MECVLLITEEVCRESLPLEKMGFSVHSQYVVKDFFSLQCYECCTLTKDLGLILIGVFKPIESEWECAIFTSFLSHIKECVKKGKNLYYYPRPHQYYQADEVCFFMAHTHWHLEKFLVEIMYRVGQLPISVRNSIHSYLAQGLFAQKTKKITLEGRPLSNLCSVWEGFKADKRQEGNILIQQSKKYYPAPLHVNLGTINRCNLKCSFCFFFAPEYQKTHTTDFFKEYRALDEKIVHDLLDYCAEHNCLVDLVGPCEMLVDKRVPDFIKYGKQQGVRRISMTTNGLLLDREMSHRLIDSGLDSLSISIDAASEEAYKNSRGGDFKRLVANVEYFLDTLESSGKVDSMHISLSMILTDSVIGGGERILFENKWRQYKAVNELYIRNLVKKENEGKEVLHTNNFTFKERLVCQKMWDEVHINPDGGVMPCCHMSGVVGWDNTTIGNLYENSLEEIWNGLVAERFRRDLVHNDFSCWKTCRTCKEWSYVSSEDSEGNISSPVIEFVQLS